MENKQTRGRQRIDTSKRRESEEDRFVTFSKRRVGLYKKAGELCTLCGTELVILIFSPSGKPFTFGHPNIEAIAKRFLKLDPHPNGDTNEIVDACLRNKIDDLNEHLTQLNIEMEAEKERGQKLAQVARARQNKPLCDQKIHELSDVDAQRLKVWLLELQTRINNRLDQLVANNSNNAAFLATADAIDPDVASSSNDYDDIDF